MTDIVVAILMLMPVMGGQRQGPRPRAMAYFKTEHMRGSACMDPWLVRAFFAEPCPTATPRIAEVTYIKTWEVCGPQEAEALRIEIDSHGFTFDELSFYCNRASHSDVSGFAVVPDVWGAGR